MAETMRTITGENGPIPVVEEGAGRTVLVIHGGSGDLDAWAEVAARLSADFRVLRYTRPTYRLEPAPSGADAVRAEVADALAVARAAGTGILLVGHSSGAVVALETALADATPFAALALYEPPLGVTHSVAGTAALRRARAALDAQDPVAAMRIHLTELVGAPAAAADELLSQPAARAYFARVAAGQIADNEMLDALPRGFGRFATLALPTLLITGEDSPAHLRDRSRELAGALGGRVARAGLRGQGHGANRDDPDALAAAIRAFAATLE